jgi:hypothetical protein
LKCLLGQAPTGLTSIRMSASRHAVFRAILFVIFLNLSINMGDTRCRSLLRHFATNRKVAGLIPVKTIRFFNRPNPSSRNMARVDSSSNRNEYQESFWGVNGCRIVRLTTSLPCVSRLSTKCGNFDVFQPYGPSWPVTGITLLFFLLTLLYPLNCRRTSPSNC